MKYRKQLSVSRRKKGKENSWFSPQNLELPKVERFYFGRTAFPVVSFCNSLQPFRFYL